MRVTPHSKDESAKDLLEKGYCFISGKDYILDDTLTSVCKSFIDSWERLPLDEDLTNVDKQITNHEIYRYRRFCRFNFHVDSNALTPLPHTPFFQSEKYNQGAGGFERHFAAIELDILSNEFFLDLIKHNYTLFPKERVRDYKEWTVYAHQIRIVGKNNVLGKPTPEGIHQDDVEFFSVHAINITKCHGGESYIYDLSKNNIDSFKIYEFMDSYFVDDKKVMHSVSPISEEGSKKAQRDVLIISFLH